MLRLIKRFLSNEDGFFEFLAPLAGAFISGSSANKAANTQAQAAQDAAQVQQNIFDTTTGFFEPYRESGENALRALEFELGLGPRPTFGGTAPNLTIEEVTTTTPGTGVEGLNRRDYSPQVWQKLLERRGGGTSTQFRVGDRTFGSREEAQAFIDSQPLEGGTPFQGFTATPGYEFRRDQGVNAIDASAAARGGLNSGATLQALTEFGQNHATNAYENWLNRIGGLASTGQASAGQQAALGQNFANSQSNLLTQGAAARAAGQIGVGNALNTGLDALGGIFSYQSAAPTTSPRPVPRPY